MQESTHPNVSDSPSEFEGRLSSTPQPGVPVALGSQAFSGDMNQQMSLATSDLHSDDSYQVVDDNGETVECRGENDPDISQTLPSAVTSDGISLKGYDGQQGKEDNHPLDPGNAGTSPRQSESNVLRSESRANAKSEFNHLHGGSADGSIDTPRDLNGSSVDMTLDTSASANVKRTRPSDARTLAKQGDNTTPRFTRGKGTDISTSVPLNSGVGGYARSTKSSEGRARVPSSVSGGDTSSQSNRSEADYGSTKSPTSPRKASSNQSPANPSVAPGTMASHSGHNRKRDVSGNVIPNIPAGPQSTRTTDGGCSAHAVAEGNTTSNSSRMKQNGARGQRTSSSHLPAASRTSETNITSPTRQSTKPSATNKATQRNRTSKQQTGTAHLSPTQGAHKDGHPIENPSAQGVTYADSTPRYDQADASTQGQWWFSPRGWLGKPGDKVQQLQELNQKLLEQNAQLSQDCIALQQDKERRENRERHMSDEIFTLGQKLREAREEHAAVRTELQTVNNRELSEVVDGFVMLKTAIQQFCFGLSGSISQELDLDGPDASIYSSEDLLNELGSAAGLCGSDTMPSSLPSCDAFFEFALRNRINRTLEQHLFDLFHPMMHGHNGEEENRKFTNLYKLVRSRESHLGAAKWRAVTFETLETNWTACDGVGNAEYWSHWFAGFMTKKITRIVGLRCGKEYTLHEGEYEKLLRIGLTAYEWNRDIRATFLPCELRVVGRPESDHFDPHGMKPDSGGTKPQHTRILLPIGLGLIASSNLKSVHEEVWSERMDVLMPDEYFLET